MNIIFKTINILLTIAILLILPVVVFTLVSSKTNIIYGIKSFVILTGSMEPNLPTGSVIYTKPVQNYSKGDIIAFKQADRTVTHRIVDVKGTNTFVTKGDANNAADNDPVSLDRIIGKQLFSIPYLGFFIVVPIVIFITFEIWNLKKEIEKQVEKKLLSKMNTT